MLTIKEAIIVEGKYDKAAVERVCASPVFTTDGFGIFRSKQKVSFLRALAKKRGLLVLTDSDRAGFLIRNRINSVIKEGTVRHAYIPEVYGKEKRKRIASKEGKLGVEGFGEEALLSILEKYAVSPDNETVLTKQDLYDLGLYGGAHSAAVRRALCRELEIPAGISVNALLRALTALTTKEELYKFAERFQCITDTEQG